MGNPIYVISSGEHREQLKFRAFRLRMMYGVMIHTGKEDRQDDEPPRTPQDSPFRKFDVKCLKCGSYGLGVSSEFHEGAGELRVILSCPGCREREVLRVP
jgi:hypothetical protein